MTHTEAEVVNVKALMLLQSTKPDATHALRSMLIDAIFNKFGSKRQTKPIPPIWQPASSDSKRSEEASAKKSPKIKSPARSPETIDSSDSDSRGSENALEILEGSLTTCSVCRGERFASKNLVECSECHLLYHKECHSPPITEDLSDPRVVWYCRNCIKPVCKPKTSDSSSSKPSSKSTSSAPKSSSSSSSSSKTFGPRVGQSKSSSSSSQSKSHIPSINIISADKRLQIMKKKAARKQDKRTISK